MQAAKLDNGGLCDIEYREVGNIFYNKTIQKKTTRMYKCDFFKISEIIALNNL
jgi:hypothetical protein